MVLLIPSAGWRRLITGFLFRTTGALIALSPLGKESGAHINPVVTLAFWLMGKLRARHALGYMLSQFTGAVVGALPLMAWGRMGSRVAFGATLPGAGYGVCWALLGEVATTCALIVGLFFFLRRRRLRPFTPALFPILYAAMVFMEAPISGTSTNPAPQPRARSDLQRLAWLVDLLVGPIAGHCSGRCFFPVFRVGLAHG